LFFSTEASFLFLKAPKTAGTAIEVWLSQIYFNVPLLDDGEHPEISPRIDKRGVMTRTSLSQAGKFEIRPHTTFDGAITLLGEQTITSSTIATCVRNPFDQIFSFFWWNTKVHNGALHTKLMSAGRKEISAHFTRFTKRLNASWLRQKRFVMSKNADYSAHHVIRYENLEADISKLGSQVLGLDSSPALPRIKTGLRPSNSPYQDFYDAKSRKKIELTMAWELEHLGYSF